MRGELDFTVLDWDSKNFGFKVGRILAQNLDLEALESILQAQKKLGLRLVYCFLSCELPKDAVQTLGGKLVDEKTTYVSNLNEHSHLLQVDPLVTPYQLGMSTTKLESLAVQSGIHSRFSVDEYFPQEKFESLYKNWINRSIKKEIASEVLVIQQDSDIVGMITLTDKDDRGDIGLVAVDQHYRGMRYGTILIKSAMAWFLQNGFGVGQVVTQGSNVQACKLYEKCGYSREKVQFVYHFWL